MTAKAQALGITTEPEDWNIDRRVTPVSFHSDVVYVIKICFE